MFFGGVVRRFRLAHVSVRSIPVSESCVAGACTLDVLLSSSLFLGYRAARVFNNGHTRLV